jgi:hypothetical protein
MNTTSAQPQVMLSLLVKRDPIDQYLDNRSQVDTPSAQPQVMLNLLSSFTF